MSQNSFEIKFLCMVQGSIRTSASFPLICNFVAQDIFAVCGIRYFLLSCRGLMISSAAVFGHGLDPWNGVLCCQGFL